MPKMPRVNICINRVYTKGRKWSTVFEYSKLFLQLHKWYKVLDALDLVKNLPQVHSNHKNNDSLLEHSFPAPLVYLLSHTLKYRIHLSVTNLTPLTRWHTIVVSWALVIAHNTWFVNSRRRGWTWTIVWARVIRGKSRRNKHRPWNKKLRNWNMFIWFHEGGMKRNWLFFP